MRRAARPTSQHATERARAAVLHYADLHVGLAASHRAERGGGVSLLCPCVDVLPDSISDTSACSPDGVEASRLTALPGSFPLPRSCIARLCIAATARSLTSIVPTRAASTRALMSASVLPAEAFTCACAARCDHVAITRCVARTQRPVSRERARVAAAVTAVVDPGAGKAAQARPPARCAGAVQSPSSPAHRDESPERVHTRIGAHAVCTPPSYDHPHTARVSLPPRRLLRGGRCVFVRSLLDFNDARARGTQRTAARDTRGIVDAASGTIVRSPWPLVIPSPMAPRLCDRERAFAGDLVLLSGPS